MIAQLLNVVLGVAGQMAYQDTFPISDSQKTEFIDPANWSFDGANSAIILLGEMQYLFTYKNFFIQVVLTVKNNAVIKVDIITDETKRVNFNAKTENNL